MTCSTCGAPATYIDDRAGAETVGFCQEHLPLRLQPLASELAVQQAPPEAGDDVQPTGVGNPTPLESALAVGETPDDAEPTPDKAGGRRQIKAPKQP